MAEKTIKVCGEDVRFRVSAATYIHYRSQMDSEYAHDIRALRGGKDFKLDYRALRGFVWAAAKTADREIPEPELWFDSFDGDLDIVGLWSEVQKLTGTTTAKAEDDEEDEEESEPITSSIIVAMCGKLGLSVADLSEMSVPAFFDTVKAWCDMHSTDSVRDATAEDIAEFKRL